MIPGGGSGFAFKDVAPGSGPDGGAAPSGGGDGIMVNGASLASVPLSTSTLLTAAGLDPNHPLLPG